MAKKVKLEAELGLNTKEFDEKIGKTKGSFDELGKSGTLSIGAVITAALSAAAVMFSWMKNTEWGASAMNKGLAMTKQLLQEILSHTENLSAVKKAGKLSEARSAEIADESREQYLAAKMQSQINQLTTQAADQTKSLAEKKNLLNAAMEKEKELKAFLLGEARKDLQIAYDQWEMNLGNIDAKNAYYEAAKRVVEIQGMDSRRLMSQFTGVLEQQAQRARDLAEAFTDVAEAAQEVNNIPINKVSTGKPNIGIEGVFQNDNKLAKAPEFIGDITKELSYQQEALLELSDMFSGFFTNVDDGFQGMIDGVIKGIERLVVELLAKAAILAILSAITGVPMPALNTILPAGMNTLMGGSTGGTSSAGLSMATPAMGSGKMTSEISGKKLKFLIDNRS